MKFSKPQQKIDFPKEEEKTLDFWKRERIFERTVDEKPKDKLWSFYDGPPFATGLPHYGHLLAGTIKDVIPRYWAMRGFRVERRFGWDCHGLPIEFEMEKTLELKGRKDILDYGVDRFNEACRSIVLRYTNEWRTVVERLGRWIDFDNDYKTMDTDFMESVWSVFKQLWEKGLIYEDKKVLPYSTRITTPLSNFEANLNYKDVQDPSIYVQFELEDEADTYFLVWTTTPWTLPANMAITAHADFNYAKVELADSGKKLIVHEDLVESVLAKGGIDNYKTVETLTGSQLKGRRYKQLFQAFVGKTPEQAFTVLNGDFVTCETGTGLVHTAPAFGEDDFISGKPAGLEPMDHLDENGVMTDAVPQFSGLYFKDADKPIMQDLKKRGLLFHQSTIQHSYPYCYRSDTPLIYRAISTWFVSVTKFKEQLVANNQQIHWVPEHLKDGRFGKWLEAARDWAISRNRFWGNPIPVWRDEESGEAVCIGSKKELEELTGQKVDDIHKHFIDDLTIKSEKTGKILKRVPHVLDCWFESGSMPYAQQHYPFDIDDKAFAKIFPADFIAEGLDQTRGWFYTLLVLSTALEKGPAFKNVVVNGIVLAEDGRKMSKRLKNYPSPEEVFDKFGSDTLRIYFLQSGAMRGEDLKFSEEGLVDMTRKVLLPLWNAYTFLATYAAVDGFDPEKDLQTEPQHELDRWITVKLELLKQLVQNEMEQYHLSRTVAPLIDFLDDLTNWYIRRSRRRFWKSENDSDKFQAYSTLYSVLLDFCKLAAPFIPFIAETVYQQLKLGHANTAADSVHLCPYPEAAKVSTKQRGLAQQMDLARNIVALGRELREKEKLRIRQPLAKLFVGMADAAGKENLAPMLSIIKEELNVKEVEFAAPGSMARWTLKPNFKLLGKKLGAKMPAFQKTVR